MRKLNYLVIPMIALVIYGFYALRGPTSSAVTNSVTPAEESGQTEQPQATAADQKSHLAIPSRDVASDVENKFTLERLATERLQRDSSQAWDIRRDEMTDRVRTVARGELKSEKASSARAAADLFIQNYGVDLFGVPARQLLFAGEAVTDRTRVTYKQIVDGSEVYGGSLNLFFENGSLTRVQNDLAPLEPSLGTSPLDFTLAQAFQRYRDLQSKEFVTTLSRQAATRTVLFPTTNRLVYAYEFSVHERSVATGEEHSYRILFNAEDRLLIKKSATEIR